MMITVRLGDELRSRLEHAALTDGVSKSEIVRRSVEAYLQNHRSSGRIAWEAGKHLFGKHSSGRSDVSERTEEILGEIFDHKRRHR